MSGRLSRRVERFTESVIREMTRAVVDEHGGVNVAQGLLGALDRTGFVTWKPQGADYVLTDVAHFMKQVGAHDDTAFAMYDVLLEAGERLQKLRAL